MFPWNCSACTQLNEPTNQLPDRHPTRRLWGACRGNNLVHVRKLLLEGADVRYIEPYSKTSAMAQACVSGNYQVVKLLLMHGADPGEADDNPGTGASPRWYARRNKHTDLIRLFEHFDEYQAQQQQQQHRQDVGMNVNVAATATDDDATVCVMTMDGLSCSCVVNYYFSPISKILRHATVELGISTADYALMIQTETWQQPVLPWLSLKDYEDHIVYEEEEEDGDSGAGKRGTVMLFALRN